MLVQRALVTFSVGPLVLFLIFKGGLYFFLPFTALIILATLEYTHLMELLGWKPSFWVLVSAVVLQLVAGYRTDLVLLGPAIVVSLLLVLFYVLWSYEHNHSTTVPGDWMAMMGGIILLGWVGSHFFRLRGIEYMAWQWTMLAMLSTWIADSAALLVGKYVAGNILGKHPLSPRLSPNKTLEGYIGGIIFGTSATIAIAYYFKLPLLMAIILGLLVSVISPAGDLGISLLKRQAGVKDSGAFLPGHGGALDRIDSLVWSVTLAYYLVSFIS